MQWWSQTSKPINGNAVHERMIMTVLTSNQFDRDEQSRD
jgi:hypothetical protein